MPKFIPSEEGQWVKFDDIKEFLKPTANTGSLQSLKLAFLGGYVAGSKVDAVHHDVAFNEWLERQQAGA